MAQGLRKLRQERRVPLSFKVFVFLLTAGSPAVRAFHVSAPLFPFRDDFKAHFSHCFCDVAAGPENAQTEKCDVGQITELCAGRKKALSLSKYKASVAS